MEKAFYAYPSVCTNITFNFGQVMCVCGDGIGSYDDTLDICVLRFFRTRLVKLVPIAHGSNADQAYGVQEFPSEPYVYPLDEIVRTIRIIPLREDNVQVYPRTYIRNIRIRRKDMTVADHPFPQPYVRGVGSNLSNQFGGRRIKFSESKLSKKAQKSLLKKSIRKISTNKQFSVRYTDLCFPSSDDSPKISDQVYISPPNPILDVDSSIENLVESSNSDSMVMKQSSISNENVDEVEAVQYLDSESIAATQNTDNENLSAIHNYLESDEKPIASAPDDNILSSLDFSPVDYGPLIPSVEANDFALNAAHDAMVLDTFNSDPMLSSTAEDDPVDFSTHADFDADVFNDLIESLPDFQ